MVSAARSDKDGDNQAQSRKLNHPAGCRIQHWFRPEVELLARSDCRINGTILVVQRDVFQRPCKYRCRYPASAPGTVNTEEPQQGVEDHVRPAHDAAHCRQRLGDGVHDYLVEVAAVGGQHPGDNPEDVEDQEAWNQR